MQKIASAFVKAKRQFSPALKTSTNPHFRSKYADLGTCLDAVNDALLEHGIAVIQETFMDDAGVTVETVFLHESGESLRGGKLHVPAAKSDPQGYGSALTYARRYSLMAACGIAAEDDDGNAASRPSPRREEKPAVGYDELLADLREASLEGTAALLAAHKRLRNTPGFSSLWEAEGDKLKRAAKIADGEPQEAAQ